MKPKQQYSNGVIAGMQMLYGDGFLSPGGATEIKELLNDLNPSGLSVLDIGCGLGGCAITMAQIYNASHVTAVDVEPDLVARAKIAVEKAGLNKKINILLVESGHIDVSDQSFDLVITKDVVCHIHDKVAFMTEIFRVLKPGGSYLCADFLDTSDIPSTPDKAHDHYARYVASMRSYGLTFNFESREAYERAIQSTGLNLIDVRDHTSQSADLAAREMVVLKGRLAANIRDALGEDLFNKRVCASNMRQKALEARGFLHVHFHAQKPA